MGVAYHIIENEFKRDQTSAYKLSILAGVDSLVYSVYEYSSNKLLLLKTLDYSNGKESNGHYSRQLDETIGQEDVLNPVYQEVRVAFLHSETSLVPARLFNEEAKSTYIDGLKSAPTEGKILTDVLESLKIKSVYSLDQSLAEVLTDRFPNVRIFSAATPFLIGCTQAIPQNVEESAVACFQKDTFQLALFRKDELLFYNNFNCNAASDVLYFVLLSFEQNGFDPNQVPLYLTGHVVNDSEIYKLLYRYISELSFLDTPTFFETGKSASSLNPNFFFPLHALLLCE